jgi:Protein of unknown function (DUF2723)
MMRAQAPLKQTVTASCSALLAFSVTLAAFVRTLLPGVVGGDAGELQSAGPLLALAHAPGAPLYLSLGYLWSHLFPIGSVAYRMNLLAALSGAAACAVVAWMLVRLGNGLWVGLSAALALGLGATFWSQAVIADKYAFTALLAAITTGLALLWVTQREKPHSDRLLLATCLAYGLCLLHHRSLFLFGPGLALMVIVAERDRLWRRPGRTLAGLGLAILPAVLVYPLFLPWVEARHRSLIEWQPHGVADWIEWWLDRQLMAGSALNLGAAAGSSLAQRLAIYGQTLWHDYTPLLPLGALLGAGLLLRRRLPALVFLGVTFILTATLAANYRGNTQQFTIFYLPSFVVLAYAFGLGIGELTAWLREKSRQWPDIPRRAALALAALALLTVPAYEFVQGYPVRRAEATFGAPLDTWRQVLKTGNLGQRLADSMNVLPENAVVIGDWEQASVFWYYQQVEGRRPDLAIVYPIDRLGVYEGGRRPICLARSMSVSPEWHPSAVGPLACLARQPATNLPAGATPLGLALLTPEGRPALELAAYHLGAPAYRAGSYAPLTLVWRALGDRREDYHISLHILDEGWRQVWAEDAAPVLGMYPTSRWTTGEVVQDYRELAVQPSIKPGRYLWTVVVYRQLADGSFEQLRDAKGNIEILGGAFDVLE